MIKYDLNGYFEILKARLGARGNEIDANLYKDKCSPTMPTVHVMMVLAIAANGERKVRVLNIGNVFLEADMEDGEDLYVALDAINSQFMDDHGRLVAKSIIWLYYTCEIMV